VYTVAGDYTVRLELIDDSLATKSALVNLTVRPAAFTSLEASPTLMPVTPGEPVQLRVIAKDVYGNEFFNPTGVTWSMLTSQAGTVDANGLFIGGTSVGSYPNAIQASLGGLTDLLSVTIYWPWNFRLSLPLLFTQ
jgi:hypothetical protein